METINEHVLGLIGRQQTSGEIDYVDAESVLHRGANAASIQIHSKADLFQLSELYSPGTIAFTAGFGSMWQLDVNKKWVPIVLEEGDPGEDIYSDLSVIADIIRHNSIETNKKCYPIGDQLIIPWKDMDDENHNTDETAYQVAWDIVDHNNVELQDGSIVPGMFLQMHLCSAYGVQFSAKQAFYHCETALAAGTYKVTFAAKYSNAIPANSIVEFTLSQSVPANGRLYMDTAALVSSYAADEVNPIEQVQGVVTSSSSATSLGTVDATASGSLNRLDRIKSGSNRWSTSAIRQYLNKSGDNWFACAENFDIRPGQYDKKGFMTGFDEDFLNALKPVKVITALNTIEGYSADSEDTYDTFFLPSLQQMNITPQLADIEGSVFPYWKERLDLEGYASTDVVYDAFKIPAINNASPQNVRLRSVNRGYASYPWLVHSAGYVYGSNASSANCFSPVCVIC